MRNKDYPFFTWLFILAAVWNLLGAGGRRFESCHLDNKLESLFYRGFFVRCFTFAE